MQNFSLIKLSLTLVFGLLLVCNSGVAQDGSSTKEKTAEEKEKSLAMTIELYSTIMSKTFEKADVEETQMEKIKEIIDECIPNLVKTRHKVDSMMTPEQKKIYNAALRQALRAKYSQKDAEKFALKKVKLSAEDHAALVSAKADVEKINKDMNDRIEGLLTDEQKAKLPMYADKKPKLGLNKIRFPGMKTEEDAKKIQGLVNSIKGAKTSELSLKSRSIRIDLPSEVNLESALNKLIAADNKILEGWQRYQIGTTTKSGSGKKAPVKVTPSAGSSKAGSGSK